MLSLFFTANLFDLKIRHHNNPQPAAFLDNIRINRVANDDRPGGQLRIVFIDEKASVNKDLLRSALLRALPR